ncbi:MAG TPA: hypothetical protein VK636_18395 [Gemmatimonadaceae bacterium]|nr:hypothetical protein [Gemmatimonadaceae bacterium]
MITRQQVGLVATIALVIGGVACSNRAEPMDDGLKQDLAAARAPQASSLPISPLELGERAAPAAPKRAPQPVSRAAKRPAPPATQVTAASLPVQALPAAATQEQPRQQEQTQVPATAARPTRARTADESRQGPYKTEAEIFRQMPWIRP